mgnify:FL=1
MTDNEKLARWQGLENVRPTRLSNGTIVIIYNSNEIVPDYLNDDAAAMSLLDTLVENGYWFTLDAGSERYMFNLRLGNFDIGGFDIEASGKTRREAVVEAVLELIEKEDV